VGSLVIPESCVAITRNWDFDFDAADNKNDKDAYIISKPVRLCAFLRFNLNSSQVSGDHVLHAKLVEVIGKAAAVAGGARTKVFSNVVNAAADRLVAHSEFDPIPDFSAAFTLRKDARPRSQITTPA
jgi:hypothetical protein